MFTIVNEGSSKTIVNEGLSLTIVNETTMIFSYKLLNSKDALQVGRSVGTFNLLYQNSLNRHLSLNL